MAYDPEGEWPTISQITKELDDSGNIVKDTIRLLDQTNEIYSDMPFVPCNEGTTHLHHMDADVPQGTWRRVNTGISAVSSSTIQVRDTCGLMESRAEVDKVQAKRSGDVATFRDRQDRRIITGMNNQLAYTMFYGDTRVDPLQYYGLSPRYDSLGNPSDKPNANTFGMYHVLNAGGATPGAQTSIWLLGYAPDDGVFGIYPDSAPDAGVESDDLGEIDLRDKDGKVFRGYATHYRVQQGLAVGDWRNVVRIANVEVTAALDAAAINQLCEAMIDATFAIPDLKSVRPIFYMNRSVLARLHKAAQNKDNVQLGFDDLYGVQNQLNISKVPIKQCDALINTEAIIS